MKRVLSTSSAKERSIKKPKSSLSNSKFLTNIPKWGENVSENNNLISFTNTCTIEYFLFAMWTAWRLEPFGFQDGWPDLSKNIYEIIQNIENNEWKKGKSIWTTKVKKKRNRKSLDRDVLAFIPREMRINMFVRYFLSLKEHTLLQRCSSSCEI